MRCQIAVLRWIRLVFLLSVGSFSVVARGASPEGFSPIFNGKTLDGWAVRCKPEEKDATMGFWRVEGGAILADSIGKKEHDYVWLTTVKEYGDFELLLRFQVERGVPGNSGVQIRSRYDDEAGYLDGPQIDIHPPDPWRTGMIWDETRGNQRWLYPAVAEGSWVDPSMAPKGFQFFHADDAGGWNDLTILADGMKIKAWLNGILVTDYDGTGVLDDAVHQQRRVGRQGMIALQIHAHDELRIRFKDLWIKELTP